MCVFMFYFVFLNTNNLKALLSLRDAASISVSNSGYSPHEGTWTFKLNSASSASTSQSHKPCNTCLYCAMLQK